MFFSIGKSLYYVLFTQGHLQYNITIIITYINNMDLIKVIIFYSSKLWKKISDQEITGVNHRVPPGWKGLSFSPVFFLQNLLDDNIENKKTWLRFPPEKPKTCQLDGITNYS